jgi:hypothetical protein
MFDPKLFTVKWLALTAPWEASSHAEQKGPAP